MIHISSSEYRKYILAICKLQEPVTSVYLYEDKVEKTEKQIFYLAKINGEKINLTGYFLYAPAEGNRSISKIVPEIEFIQHGDFWIGATSAIFKDYTTSTDKKLGKLSWTAAYERELVYPELYVDLNEPIIEMSFSLSQLERMTAEASSVPKANGVLLTNTTSDVVLDKPPVGLIPSGIEN